MTNEIEKENGNYELKLSEIKEETKSVISKKELHSYILFVINQFIWGFQGLQLKSFFYFFSKDYDINSFVFYRHLGLCIVGYLSIRYKNITLNFPWQIHHRIWFYIRNIGIYICIRTWMASLEIFRLSTCQILGGVGPLLTILFSVVFLKEKFYMVYAYGIFICFIGSAMIILNERKSEENDNKNSSSLNFIFLGSIYLTINVTLFSLGLIGQKFLCKEKLSPEEQTFYFGFYSVIIAGFFCIIKLDFKLSNILYCLYSLLNGFIFYICNFLNSVSFQNIEISKLQPVSYLSTVLVVIASAVIFKENLYFTDIIGALMIIGFIIYNGMYPPKS